MIAGIITGTLGLLFFLITGLLGLAYVAFWLWMLIHAITNKGLADGERVAWVIVMVFLHLIGPLLYFFIGRPKGTAGIG